MKNELTEDELTDLWRNVPASATHIAMDHDGKWYWYVGHPIENHARRCWDGKGRFGCILPQPEMVKYPWLDSLMERPG
jgi:hypothetical protein